MIQVSQSISIDKIEAFYSQLAEESKNGIVDISIPVNIISSDFGIIPAMIQLISTWLRNPNAGKLVINFQDFSSQVESFFDQEYSYPIVIMAWRRGIYLPDQRTELKRLLKPYTTAIRQQMKSLASATGNRLLLTCFDHLAEHNGLLDCFYSGDTFIKSEDLLYSTILPPLLQAFSLNKSALKDNVAPIFFDLIGIIYELMKNTDDWARTDRSNKPFNPNVRGLFTRIVRRKKSTFIATYSGHEGFSEYFNDINTNAIEEQYFAEISIFDSGAGFIEKYAKSTNNLSITDRVNIVKQCLIRHCTSATGLRAHGKGQGLDRMLQILDNKGLLWIRTDRVSLYRNLRKDRYALTEKDSQVRLYDWTTHMPNSFCEQYNVSGSILTIIYPIL